MWRARRDLNPGLPPSGSGLRVKSPPLYRAELRAHLYYFVCGKLITLLRICIYTEKSGGCSFMSEKRFNIFKHELVPKHEVVPIEEAVKILKELGVRPEQLPWIKASDPAARAIGAKPGDIVRIVRKSETAGEIVVYRYVIAG
jgi:DNA-directed RNA polymerase subunit H